MSQKTVYLAGPISGLNYFGATYWRKEAIQFLATHNISGLSPMRAQTPLQHEDSLTDAYEGADYKSVLLTGRGIYIRDKFDCFSCDLILVNLLEATKVSIGTVMEIAWACGRGIPVVAVMESQNNPHDHGMIREAIGFRTETLKEGLSTVVHILGAYGQPTANQ